MTTVQLIEFIVFMIVFCCLCIYIGIGISKLILYIDDIIKKKFIRPKYNVYVYYQPNPIGRNTSDCSIRAISKIFNITWNDALDLIVECAKKI